MNVIEFPGLGLKFNIDRIAIHLPIPSGGIMWYAILIVCGIVLAYIIGSREYKRLGGNKDDLLNMLIFALPVAIICARLYYVVFSLDSYTSFWDIFKIWEGGLAIYGGVIGAVLVVVIYCRRHRLSILMHLDIAAYGFLIGQAIGRWGNFINGEAYGVATDLPWRMVVNGVVAHPTFLYESLWNTIGFLLIWFTRKKGYFSGRSACLYMIWYGIGRTFIELLRTDSLWLGGIRVSSLLSAVLVVAGVIMYIVLRKKAINS